MKKKLKIIAFLLSIIMLLCACGSEAVVPQVPVDQPLAASEPAEAPDASADVGGNASELAIENIEEPKTVENIRAKMGDMGVRLIDTLAASSDGNVVISDLSINMALCMILEGAEGETKEVLENYLGISKEDASLINQKIISMLNSSEMEELKVTIANSIWVDEQIEVNPDYIAKMIDEYSAEASTVPMNDPKTAKTINQWCSDHTNGLIPEIVSADAIRDMAAVLVNALYFKGTWIDEFGDAQDGEFDGKPAKMMHGDGSGYLENENAIGFSKPYYGSYRFIGILPKAEGDFTLAGLNIESLLNSETFDYDVHVTMPKFENSYSATLKDALKSLGLDVIFEENADFSGIAKNIFVDEIIHKTQFNLDEHGTEAAAVTAIIMKANGVIMEPPETKEVILNRPFAFMIMDYNGNALFTGKILAVEQ